jgi:hypothetical protein
MRTVADEDEACFDFLFQVFRFKFQNCHAIVVWILGLSANVYKRLFSMKRRRVGYIGTIPKSIG